MKLQKRLVIYVILFFAFLLGSFYFMFRGSMLSNIQYFEEKEAVQAVESSIKHINFELTHLVAFIDDWGAWTEAYDFVQGKNHKRFVTEYLGAEALAKQKFDFIAFTNMSGQIVHGTLIDHNAIKTGPLTEDITDFIVDLSGDKKVSGIKVLDGKIYLVASGPALMSMYRGVPQGLIVVGREVSTSMVHLDKEDNALSFSVVMGGYDYFDGPYQPFIEKVTKNSIAAVAIVKDIHNKPALKIALDFNREMYSYAKKKLFYLFIFLFVISSVFSLGIIVLLHKVMYLQQRIFHNNRLASLGTLGAGIAHELNNPLAVVYGYAQNLEKLIEEKQIKDPECRDGISKILTYTNRMKEIVEKIGVFSRSGESLNTSKTDDINSIISDSLLLIRKDLELKSISLALKLEGKIPSVVVNPIKMETVLHNIILNSKEELENLPQRKDKKITISSEFNEQEGFVIVKIADNGRGISQEHLFRVFDPFFTTKPFGKGTGLGLSIVHGIMREMGGKVEIETKEKAGTTLILKIPAVFSDE